MNINKNIKMENPLNRIIVVQKIIDKLNAKRYLEVGVHNGDCFLSLNADRKFAVDPFFQISSRNKKNAWRNDYRNLFNQYFEMTSDHFFETQKATLKKKFDVIFIDGLHTYEQTLKDVTNSLNYLKDNGIIVMHDCFPPFEAAAYPAVSLEAAEKANPSGWTGEWCGDVWKTIVNLRSLRSDCSSFVLNCDKGLGIVIKKSSTDKLNYSLSDIEKLDYSSLMSNPKKLIGLKEESYFTEFLQQIK